MSTTTTTLKLPAALKTRLARVAKRTGRTPHAFMIDAIERQTAYEEQLGSFVKEAVAADRAIDQGADVYAAADVHTWIDGLARGRKPARPRPWRR